MSSNTGHSISILEEALDCISRRICRILIQSSRHGDNEAYIDSLHNELLAAVWIVGLLSSTGSSPTIPPIVRLAFQCFPDIKNPRTYSPPDKSIQPNPALDLPNDQKFNLTEWWNIEEGEKLSKPFDVREELVPGLLRALETRLATADIRTKTINAFKDALDQRQEIEHQIWLLRNYIALEHNSWFNCEEDDPLDNGEGSHEA